MAFSGQDISTLYLGLTGNGTENIVSFYGVRPNGDVEEVYNSSDRLPVGAFQGGIITETAVQIGDSLYFVEFFRFGKAEVGEFDDRYFVSRLNKDGTVETLAQLPGGTRQDGTDAPDQLDTAFVHNGTYHVIAGTGITQELFSVSADGDLTQLTSFARPFFPGAENGFATVKNTLFLIGDQNTPNGVKELWRVLPGGGQEVVFSDGVNSIKDVESFANRAWFITSDMNPFGANGRLFSITETGAARRVSLPKNEVAMFLDTDADGLMVVTRDPTINRTTISTVAADGTINRIMSAGFVDIFDICGFGDDVFFIGSAVGSSGNSLYKIGPNGTAQLVTGIGKGIPDPNVENLYVSGGKLWFQASTQVPDGFGGFTPILDVLHSMDATGKIQIVSGAPGNNPNITTLEGYEFALDFPDPVIGTSGADVLSGTAQGELISGLGQNDIIRGFSGGDTVYGGTGADLIAGDRGSDLIFGGGGDDRISGGLESDTMTGGLGADTFVFDATPNRISNVDSIEDFASGIDKIQLALAAMPGLGSAGALSVDAFRSGPRATQGLDANDRIVYNTVTGDLYYDADGSGDIKSVKIAELGPFVTLLFTDILIA
jgi:Ca2+-binding RTX toxin-like protein